MNLQELIFRLQRFWSDQGCLIDQSYDLEVGAGTFHLSTFLRSLGPEPWNVAYVQASRRPKSPAPAITTDTTQAEKRHVARPAEGGAA